MPERTPYLNAIAEIAQRKHGTGNLGGAHVRSVTGSDLATAMATRRSPSWLSRTFDESEVRATTGGLSSLSPVPPIGHVS